MNCEATKVNIQSRTTDFEAALNHLNRVRYRLENLAAEIETGQKQDNVPVERGMELLSVKTVLNQGPEEINKECEIMINVIDHIASMLL